MRISLRSVVSLVVVAGVVAVLAVHARATRLDRSAPLIGDAPQDLQNETPLPAADLVLLNGRVVTLEPAQPESQAIAIRDDLIYVIGTNDDIKKRIGPSTESIDLHGQLVIPGFIESHGHFAGIGEMKLQ